MHCVCGSPEFYYFNRPVFSLELLNFLPLDQEQLFVDETALSR